MTRKETGPDRPTRSRFGLPFQESAHRADVDDEIAFHLETLREKLIDQGMSSREADLEVRRRFGDAEGIRRQLNEDGKRGAVMTSWIDMGARIRSDVAAATRSLIRTPALSGASVGILAIGIGATAAFFAVVHAVVMEPMPFAEPDRVVQIEVVAGPEGDPSSLVSPGIIIHWQDGVPGVDAVAGVAGITAALAIDPVPLRVMGLAVGHRYTEIVGVQPQLGRNFTAADDVPGAEPVALLSHRLWASAFGSDPTILGQEIGIDGVATTIIGVMPSQIDVLEGQADFWRPLRLDPDQRGNLGARYLQAVALLREGASITGAQSGLNEVLGSLDVRSDSGEPFHALLTPVEEVLSRPLRPMLFVTLAALGLVLLVACGNVAILLLARGSARGRELAIRAALGASRGGLIRSLLAEGVVLAGIATGLGLILAAWGVQLLKTATPFPVPRLQEAALDLPVVLFVAGLSAATVLVFGLIPAFRTSRVDVRGTLTSGEGSTSRSTGGRDRVRSAFLAVQAALCVVLLVAAGLLTRTATELGAVDIGYESEHVLSGMVALPFARYPDLTSVLERYGEIQGAIAALPAVEQAAVGSRVPLAGGGIGFGFTLDGALTPREVNTRLRIVGADYFSTLGIPIVAGRELRATDDRSAAPSVVVNQTFLRELGLSETTAVGRTVRAQGGDVFVDERGDQVAWEIVGVVADARDLGPRRDSRPELFFSLEQAPEAPWNWLGRQMVLTLRTSREPTDLIVPLQTTLRSIDPELPVYDVRTLSERVQSELARERFAAGIVLLVAMIGLLLAAAGIFGAVAYHVGRRTREIGVRVALGAGREGVVRLIVRQSLTPVVIGLLVGVPSAWFAGQALTALLYSIGPRDLPTTAAAVLALLLVSGIAALIPARRATAVDPVDALRAD